MSSTEGLDRFETRERCRVSTCGDAFTIPLDFNRGRPIEIQCFVSNSKCRSLRWSYFIYEISGSTSEILVEYKILKKSAITPVCPTAWIWTGGPQGAFQRGVIYVPNSKTGKDYAVPMNEDVRTTLLRLQFGRSRSDYVFVNSRTDKPYKDLKRSFAKACELAWIDDLHWHDLRLLSEPGSSRQGAASYD